MAISISFFLVYSKKKISNERLQEHPVSVRAQVRYTRSHLPWSAARRFGHEIRRIQFIAVQAQPRYWANGKVKHTHPDAATINATIDAIANRARALHAQYIAAGQFPTDEQYIAAMLDAQEAAAAAAAPTLLSDYARYISYLSDRKIAPNFISKHQHILDTLAQFQQTTGYLLTYENINRTFAAKYLAWCERTLTPRRKSQNLAVTAARYLKDLKIFLSHATGEEWTHTNGWRKIKIKEPRQKFPITLTHAEIQRIAALTPEDLPYKHKRAATAALITRDWLIIGTQTAMRWSDWATGRIHIIQHTPNIINLQIITEKTDDPLEIPLSTIAIAILRRHHMKMPPSYCPATTKNHLAAIARAANIQKHITTHTARRTYITHQEAAGVPRAFIMRITGHKREEDYTRYSGITHQLNADLMRKANPAMFKTAG